MKNGPPLSPAGTGEALVLSCEKRRMSVEEQSERYLFEEMPVPRAVATLAIPTIISQVVTMIYNLADTFFIG